MEEEEEEELVFRVAFPTVYEVRRWRRRRRRRRRLWLHLSMNLLILPRPLMITCLNGSSLSHDRRVT